MIWDMSIDRGSTTLALWTRSRGAYVWPLPTGPESSPATMESPTPSSTLTGSSTTFTWYPSACGAGLLDRRRQHAGRQQLLPVRQPANDHPVADGQRPAHRWQHHLRHAVDRDQRPVDVQSVHLHRLQQRQLGKRHHLADTGSTSPAAASSSPGRQARARSSGSGRGTVPAATSTTTRATWATC